MAIIRRFGILQYSMVVRVNSGLGERTRTLGMSDPEIEARTGILAADLAAYAAEFVRRRFHTAVATRFKGVGAAEPVTELDLEIERTVRDRVAAEFPGHGVVGEELPDRAVPSEWIWVIDPLDGTRNFVLGIPVVACSIALLHRGRPVVGAVALPMSDVLVTANRGSGTRWNGAPVTVSDRRIDDGSIGVFGYETHLGFEVTDPHPMHLGESRWFGSTAWELAMIAGGRIDHGVFPSTAVWDVAAGVLLITESGGRVQQLQADGRWNRFDSFGSHRAVLRQWSAPLVCGGPRLSDVVDRLGAAKTPTTGACRSDSQW
jgi:myo-inositol-1(or 4)-monophosphatase